MVETLRSRAGSQAHLLNHKPSSSLSLGFGRLLMLPLPLPFIRITFRRPILARLGLALLFVYVLYRSEFLEVFHRATHRNQLSLLEHKNAIKKETLEQIAQIKKKIPVTKSIAGNPKRDHLQFINNDLIWLGWTENKKREEDLKNPRLTGLEKGDAKSSCCRSPPQKPEDENLSRTQRESGVTLLFVRSSSQKYPHSSSIFTEIRTRGHVQHVRWTKMERHSRAIGGQIRSHLRLITEDSGFHRHTPMGNNICDLIKVTGFPSPHKEKKGSNRLGQHTQLTTSSGGTRVGKRNWRKKITKHSGHTREKDGGGVILVMRIFSKAIHAN
ncbi:hypothetical protein M5K25_025855 [Dendrobium thyrsiflorum]|uniref:Uncharacterized protein n=1 Tax=Dendrobium thyrsiflorum TaxID=117978 RepID=A0ABD0TWB9_DENTH